MSDTNGTFRTLPPPGAPSPPTRTAIEAERHQVASSIVRCEAKAVALLGALQQQGRNGQGRAVVSGGGGGKRGRGRRHPQDQCASHLINCVALHGFDLLGTRDGL